MKGTRVAVGLLAAGLAVATGLAGCGSSSPKSTSAGGNAGGVEPARGEQFQGDSANGKPDAAAPPEAGGKGGAPVPNQPAQQPKKLVPESRSIVYTGSITVRVSNVDEAASKAGVMVTGAGGFVGGDKRTINDKRSEAQLVLRVPSARFNEILASLSKDLGGKEESRAVSTEDVTDQVVDVNARITTAQASVDRVRALLARAQTISEIVSLESELSRREADLESLKARKAKLDDLTSLSTITVLLLGPDAAGEQRKKDDSGFLAGLKQGWHAFVASMVVLLTVLGALLPWIVALGLPVVAVLWLLRYRRRARPVRPEGPVPAE
jgi:Domain of unknown function (DUF4349)